MITLLNKTLTKGSDGVYKWEAKCDCGMLFLVTPNKVRTGHTKSCGCLRIKKSYERMKAVWAGERGISEKYTK